MADQKISELNTITGANVDDASDKLAIVDASGNETKAITRGELLSSVSQITTDTAGDSVAIKALRTNNSGTGNPVVIVAGDGDSGDVLVEMRGNTDATLVDTADTKESSDAQFIFYGNGASTFNGPLTLNSNAQINGNITVTGTVDGRDIATDGSKLDGIEALADVTDTANVTAAGALMDSELANEAAVKALDQGVATTDSPSFAGIVTTGDLEVEGDIYSPANTDSLRISGGSEGDGAHLVLFGSGSGEPNNAVMDADAHRFRSQAGTEWARLTGGNLGIGTTNPSEKLDVVGNAEISGDLTVDTSTLHVDSTNNRVGIGTTSPSAPLTINDTGFLKILADNGSDTPFSVGAGVNGVTIANNTGGAVTDEYIGLFQNDSTVRFGAGGSEAVRITSAGNVGIGTFSPSALLDVAGNVTISGSLSKGSGSFKIDHPLKPETHHLVHSFVEAPQADNIYRGRVDLVDGVATVNLDEAGRMTEGTFVLLNGNVQCFTSNETDWCPVRGSVNGNILTIEAQDNTCTDTISWLVIGERIDQHMIDTNWTDENGRIIVEPEKVIMESEEEVIV